MDDKTILALESVRDELSRLSDAMAYFGGFDEDAQRRADVLMVMSKIINAWVHGEKMAYNTAEEINGLAERLAAYNEWRRGAETEQPNPTQIGIDIDEAIEIIKEKAKSWAEV